MWHPNSQVIVVDVQGTVTKKGYVVNRSGNVVAGVVRKSVIRMLEYFSHVMAYKIVYVTSSPFNRLPDMRQIVKSCPQGPILLSTDGFLNHLKEKVVGGSAKVSLLRDLSNLYTTHRQRYEQSLIKSQLASTPLHNGAAVEMVVVEAASLPSASLPPRIIPSSDSLQSEPPREAPLAAAFGNRKADMKEFAAAGIPLYFKIQEHHHHWKMKAHVDNSRKEEKCVFVCNSNKDLPNIQFSEHQKLVEFVHPSFHEQPVNPESALSPLTFSILSHIFEYIPFDKDVQQKVKSQKMHLALVCQQWKRLVENRFTSHIMEIYAKKIGLTLDELTSSPHLFKFLSKNYIHKKIHAMHHRIKNDEGQVVIRYYDKEVPYDELQELFVMEFDPEKGHPQDRILIDEEYKMLNTVYTYRGLLIKPDLKKIDLEGFDIEASEDALERFIRDSGLTPHDKRDPSEWHNENVLVIKIERGENGIRNIGDHTWLQLWSQEGFVWSFGVYRESFDARLQLGDLRSPDDGEWYTCRGGVNSILPLKVTRKMFGEFLMSNLMHVRDRDVVYSLTLYNCSDYVLDQYASQLGIHFETKFNLINHALGNGTWDSFATKARKTFPSKIAEVAANTTIMLAPNITLSIMAAKQSSKLKQRLNEEDSKEVIEQNVNLFFADTDTKLKLNYLKNRLLRGHVHRLASPWKLGQIIDEINKERKERNDPWYIPQKFLATESSGDEAFKMQQTTNAQVLKRSTPSEHKDVVSSDGECDN